MKVVKKNIIDCILISFKGVNYLLPSVAFAEIGLKGEFQRDDKLPVLGAMQWRGFSLPVVAPDLSDEKLDTNRSTYAVLNALFSNKLLVPYIGLIIERHPARLKVKPQDITWIDEDKQSALYAKEGTLPKEVVMIDLQKLSTIVERVTSHKSP